MGFITYCEKGLNMLNRIDIVLSLFLRFGLSNKFDTEFPSVLTGKVSGLALNFPILMHCVMVYSML
jgi:hypothetical protein